MELETGIPLKTVLIIAAIGIGVVILVAICCICLYHYEPFKNNRFGSQSEDVEMSKEERPEISIKRA